MPGRPPDALSRRQFAAAGTRFVGLAVGVLLGVPIVGFLLSPLFRTRQLVWRQVGPVATVKAGEPAKFEVSFPNENALPAPELRFAVYVVRFGPAPSDVRVFSNICTHMQCPVRWEAGLNLFLCPCHGGLYDLAGRNVGGPPPKPLPQWEHRIDDRGTLFVRNRLSENI